MKSGAKKGPGIRARFWSLLVLAQLPKAQKTGPFLGPHFGAGEPLLSSFLESQIWARIEKCRPMPPAGQGKRPEHTFAFNSQVETCCVYSLTRRQQGFGALDVAHQGQECCPHSVVYREFGFSER